MRFLEERMESTYDIMAKRIIKNCCGQPGREHRDNGRPSLW
jgi:hypothetical protein